MINKRTDLHEPQVVAVVGCFPDDVGMHQLVVDDIETAGILGIAPEPYEFHVFLAGHGDRHCDVGL